MKSISAIIMTTGVACAGLFSAVHGLDVRIDARGGFGSHTGFDTADYSRGYNWSYENVDLLQPLSNKESVSLKSKYVGTINAKPLPQYYLSQLNELVLGFETTRIGDLFLRYGYDFYEPPAMFIARTVPSPIIHPKKTKYSEAIWTEKIKNFTFRSLASYAKLDYDYMVDTITSRERDADLWVDIGGQLNMGHGFREGVGLLLKNDLNTSSAYDYNEFSMFIGGLHSDAYQFNLVDWQVTEFFHRNQVMFNRGYGIGFATEIHVRPIFKFHNHLYVKGDIRILAGDGFQTQRYEIHVNKTWMNSGNYFTGGAWITAGGLFPRINARLLQKFNFWRIGLIPSFLIAWRPNVGQDSYSLHRTILGIEPTFEINRFFELYGGYTQTHYNGQDMFHGMYNGFFDNSNLWYFGIRKW